MFTIRDCVDQPGTMVVLYKLSGVTKSNLPPSCNPTHDCTFKILYVSNNLDLVSRLLSAEYI